MLQGKDLVELIPARLDQQTDDARARAASEFAANFRQSVNTGITLEESLEAFAVYRRFDLAQTRGGQSSSIESMKESVAKLCDDLAVHFEMIPKSVITEFVSENWNDYASKRGFLFAARSRGTHVGGVLRPLTKRYFKQWESELIKRPDYKEIQLQVDKLLTETISSKSAFEMWAESAYALFAKVGVYRPAEGDQGSGTKPNGMISEGSLRTYKQQWFSWTSENALSLFGEQTAGPEQTGSPNFESPLNSQTEADSTARAEGVRVSLHRNSDPTFKLKKYWASVDMALGELDDWLDVAKKVWGDSTEIAVDLTCLGSPLDLELRFEVDSLTLAAKKVKAFITAAM